MNVLCQVTHHASYMHDTSIAYTPYMLDILIGILAVASLCNTTQPD